MTEDDDINSQIHSSQKVKEMSAPASSANEDDDSSTCGSSSSSDSSDSESDKEDEAENAESTHTDETLTSNGNDAVPSSGSNLPTRSQSSTSTPHTESNRLRNVNSNRAAARFRQQQNAELGLMALGTKKRDRRTIEEIQRDIQKKRGKTTCGNNGNLQNSKVKKSTLNNSPALSSDSGVEPTTVLSLNASSYKMPKGKANSARSRLAMKVFGRGGRSSLSNNAKTKKNAPSTGTTGIVTNISAGTMKKTTAISDSNDSKGDRAESIDTEKMDRQVLPESSRNESVKNVRCLLRSMLRYGDLGEMNHSLGDAKTFADEYKLPNFIHRSNLCTVTKLSEEKLYKWATDITELAQKAIEKNQDVGKFMDVEICPSQLIARLYDNLKLRVAVQRALRDANCAKPAAGGMLTNGAYVLVAKQSDHSVLNIAKDCQAWPWAEKEHEWNDKKDIALLLGIYVHGFGCWEEILNDDLLHFHKQRALKGDRLRKRAENLMKKLPPPDGVVDPIIVYKAYALLADNSPASSSLPQQQPSESLATAVTNANNKGRTQLRRTNDKISAKTTSAVIAEVMPIEKKKDLPLDLQVKGKRKRSASSSPTATISSHSDEGNHKILSDHVDESGSDAHNMHPTPSSPIAIAAKNVDTTKSNKHKEGATRRTEKISAEPQEVFEYLPALTSEQMVEKWNPSKQMKDIRQVLKKIRIMAEWSKTRQDDLVVEKMLKMEQSTHSHKNKKHRKETERTDLRSEVSPGCEKELDEYSTCLWTYAASFTPFTAVQFEQLYDDMCADATTTRQREK